MPLSTGDRVFLRVVERFQIYVFLLAIAVFLFLLFTPAAEIQLATAVVGVALCMVFWLTQRLLTMVTLLDIELGKVISVLKRTLPEEQRRELSDY